MQPQRWAPYTIERENCVSEQRTLRNSLSSSSDCLRFMSYEPIMKRLLPLENIFSVWPRVRRTELSYCRLTMRWGWLFFSNAGQDPGVTASVFSAWASQTTGYPDQALKRSRDALSLAQLLSHPYSLAYARGIAAALHQFRKDGEVTQDLADASLSVATEHGFPFWSAFQTILLGWVSVKQGKAVEGI